MDPTASVSPLIERSILGLPGARCSRQPPRSPDLRPARGENIMALEKGILLRNRYRIEDTIAAGGMGAVYKALDETLRIQVAVKENFFSTEEYSRQFRREATILASLRHPNLPRVTDHFVIQGQGQYLVMDFIAGTDLREIIARDGALSEAEIIRIGAAICEALAYLHGRSLAIVHRDIKPGNLKITPTGAVVLVDFGLAKIAQGETTTTGA
ncbi:MAG: serine/threonine protein kinase, partial [Chloroflexi bacterium]